MAMNPSAALVALGAAILLATGAASMQQPPYSVARNGDIVRLQDAKAQTTVSIKPSAGNVAFEMLVKGQNVLVFTGGSPDEFKGGMTGVPFVGPWANRLDEQAFYANGTRYGFDMQLGNVRGAIPIHGFLTGSAESPVVWEVVEAKADAGAAWLTSRLDFTKHPMWMKQFPFAHTVEMTHRLQNGVLEVSTSIVNHSIEPMPVAIGFHPYFQVPDTPRSDWTISIAARTHWLLASNKVPTGETEPVEKQFQDRERIALKEHDLDDVYGDLIRDSAGRATMSVRGTKTQQVDVIVGTKWRSVVIWAPSNRNFVCFEPMAGITNAMNLAQRGLYKELQSVPPNGGVWQESFWVSPKGF
jgi:aldose 1-epimerase